MKREARLLLDKACGSLVISIEVFNRPQDRGRITTTLILLDHSFEMLLKAALVHKCASIREKRAKETIGFDACVRRCLSDGKAKILTNEQALVLQTINGLRDAAQHHLLDISEGQLYIHCQAGLTLFRDLLKSVFGQDIRDHFPDRVLPISTSAPTDLVALFDTEVEEIRKLLDPRRRRRIEAEARLRPIAIVDGALKGEKGQPSPEELRNIGRELAAGKGWQEIFKGIAAVDISAEGTGPSLSLTLLKKAGMPIRLVPEGTPGAAVVAIKRVDELGFYNLGAQQLADKVGLTRPKTIAVVQYADIRRNPDFYKEIRIGKSSFKRYSQKAVDEIKSVLQKTSADEIWAKSTVCRKDKS